MVVVVVVVYKEIKKIQLRLKMLFLFVLTGQKSSSASGVMHWASWSEAHRQVLSHNTQLSGSSRSYKFLMHFSIFL